MKVASSIANDRFAYSVKVIPDTDGNGTVDFLVGAKWANTSPERDGLITGNVYLFHGEDLLVEDSSVELSVSVASKAFPQNSVSAEYGAFVASDGQTVFAGAPGSNKHDGSVELKDLRADGSEVVIAEHDHSEHEHHSGGHH